MHEVVHVPRWHRCAKRSDRLSDAADQRLVYAKGLLPVGAGTNAGTNARIGAGSEAEEPG
jgi:hypothetical protein